MDYLGEGSPAPQKLTGTDEGSPLPSFQKGYESIVYTALKAQRPKAGGARVGYP